MLYRMMIRSAASLSILGCAIVALFGVGLSAQAADDDRLERIQGPVAAQVVKVRDGDTVEVEAFVWPQQTVHIAVRLRGVDAPELHGKCEAEKAAAQVAKQRLADLVGDGAVQLTDISGDKYFGRVLADIGLSGGESFNAQLLKEGLVERYGGGKRRDWCDQTSEAAPMPLPRKRS